jgi:hypothetical protein
MSKVQGALKERRKWRDRLWHLFDNAQPLTRGASTFSARAIIRHRSRKWPGPTVAVNVRGGEGVPERERPTLNPEAPFSWYQYEILLHPPGPVAQLLR